MRAVQGPTLANPLTLHSVISASQDVQFPPRWNSPKQSYRAISSEEGALPTLPIRLRRDAWGLDSNCVLAGRRNGATVGPVARAGLCARSREPQDGRAPGRVAYHSATGW
jgi:hypothetical protein